MQKPWSQYFEIFLLPQVKQSMIISNKHGVYKLPYKLPNDLKLRIFRNQKYQQNHKISLNYGSEISLPHKIKTF